MPTNRAWRRLYWHASKLGNLGSRPWDCRIPFTGFATINAPNQGSCTPANQGWGEGDGIYSATSYHYGGAHVVTYDVSVKFISDGVSTIDARPGVTAADYYSPVEAMRMTDGTRHQTGKAQVLSASGELWGLELVMKHRSNDRIV